jgi:type II secretory pathway pseudopilin PulG
MDGLMAVGSRTRADRQQGMALLVALGMVGLMGLGLSLAGPAWEAAVQREREQDWLRIGHLYAQALASYVAAAPGTLQQPPQTIQELLTDSRFVGIRRHLRQAYTDPLRPGQAWALLRDTDQRIIGVYSPSTRTPFSRVPRPEFHLRLMGSGERYADWAFVLPPPPSAPSSASSS